MIHHHLVHAPPRKNLRKANLVIILLLLTAIISSSLAQPRPLAYGSGVVGTVDDANPLSLFVFNGAQGDLVTVEVISLTSGLIPSLSLLSPSQQLIGSATAQTGTATLAAVLPSGGPYSVLVGSLTGAQGEFAVRLDGSSIGQPFRMFANEELRAQFSPGGEVQVLTFNAEPAGFALQLGDFTADAGTDNLRFTASVVASNGGFLAKYDGVYGAMLLVPPDAGDVFVVVGAADPEDGGGLDLVLHALDDASSSDRPDPSPQPTASTSSSSSTDSVSPVSTQEVTSPSTGECALIAGSGGVNVRAGDGTNYEIIGQIEPNGRRGVTGRNAANSWYTISISGRTGWVAGQVVTLGGDCSNLQVVFTGAQPQPSDSGPTATYTATPTTDTTITQPPTQDGAAATYTATLTSTHTPPNDHESPTPLGPTPTYTATPTATATATP